MTTAYVVTEGSYSDYKIVAVFLDRSLADELCDRHKGWYGEPRVEEYEIVTALPAAIVTLRLQCTVTDGTETESSERENVSTPDLFDGYAVESQCKTQMYVIPSGGLLTPWPRQTEIKIHVEGTDHERVRKTFSEVKAQAIADFDLLVEARRARDRPPAPPPPDPNARPPLPIVDPYATVLPDWCNGS